MDLHLPETEIGGTLTVRHMAEKIEKLTSIEINNQRIVFRGRVLGDLNCTLSILGIQNKSHINVLKIKYDPDQLKPMYKLNQLEKQAKANDVLLNKLIHRFDTMLREAIPNQMTCQSTLELKSAMNCCRDVYTDIKGDVEQMQDTDERFVKKKGQMLDRIEMKLENLCNLELGVRDILIKPTFAGLKM